MNLSSETKFYIRNYLIAVGVMTFGLGLIFLGVAL